MEIPEYVTVEEVKRICGLLEIRDWTTLQDARVLTEEAAAILSAIETEGMEIDVESFRQGLEVELEHGVRYKAANVTNNHPVLTGKIVLAHLKETLDYYVRLDVAELEGDLLKAFTAGDAVKIMKLYQKLITARHALSKAESDQVSSGV